MLGDEPALREGRGERGAGIGESDIAHERESQTDPGGGTIDCRDEGLGKVDGPKQRDFLEFGRKRTAVDEVVEKFDVCPSTELTSATSDNNRVNAGIVGQG